MTYDWQYIVLKKLFVTVGNLDLSSLLTKIHRIFTLFNLKIRFQVHKFSGQKVQFIDDLFFVFVYDKLKIYSKRKRTCCFQFGGE